MRIFWNLVRVNLNDIIVVNVMYLIMFIVRKLRCIGRI